MARLVFGMIQSLDGYVDGVEGKLDKLPVPDPALFRHFIERTAAVSGSLYGRRIYGWMRYWESDQDSWDSAEREYAAAWRSSPKWVVSRSAPELGANATLVTGDLEAFVRKLKAEVDGEIEVAGPELAGVLTDLGLIDAYELYLRPFVLGEGKPFFAGERPPLRLVGSERVGDDCIKLTYVPA